MKRLKEEYLKSIREYLSGLDKETLAKLWDVADGVTELRDAFNMNTAEETDTAQAGIKKAPYGNPDDWLSLNAFFAMIFEVGGVSERGQGIGNDGETAADRDSHLSYPE